ncbi:MAG: head-tail adaptor protein [Enterococcus sp.]|nr:head-tail adaptor protein [Enterococcus sp.]
MFVPAGAEQMTTPIVYQRYTVQRVMGVTTKSYVDFEYNSFCNFKTKGGTEITSNGLLVVEDTAELVAWYDPEVTSGDRVKLLQNGDIYEIIGSPENIEMRNKYMKMKVKRVAGGA